MELVIVLVQLVLGVEAEPAHATGVVVALWEVDGLQMVHNVVPPHEVLGTDDADVRPARVGGRPDVLVKVTAPRFPLKIN